MVGRFERGESNVWQSGPRRIFSWISRPDNHCAMSVPHKLYQFSGPAQKAHTPSSWIIFALTDSVSRVSAWMVKICWISRHLRLSKVMIRMKHLPYTIFLRYKLNVEVGVHLKYDKFEVFTTCPDAHTDHYSSPKSNIRPSQTIYPRVVGLGLVRMGLDVRMWEGFCPKYAKWRNQRKLAPLIPLWKPTI